MFCKITVSPTIGLDRKLHRKLPPPGGAKMSYYSFRVIYDTISGIPYALTQVDLFIMIKELLVKPAESSKKVASKKQATTILIADVLHTITIPFKILVRLDIKQQLG
jgi:hypothetical protein